MRSEGRHLFTAEDLKLLVEHDIKVTSIESDAIDLEEEANKILNFKPVMKEMEYLNNFNVSYVQQTYLDGPLQIHLLTDLPIKTISTSVFWLAKENIEPVVQTLSQIKSLESLRIDRQPSWRFKNCKLSAENLSKFKNLTYQYLTLTRVHSIWGEKGKIEI